MCRVALQASTNGTEADKKQNEKEIQQNMYP